METTGWAARELAMNLLAEELPTRWRHVEGVGRKAESIAHLYGADGPLLVCAAWLHDIGYSSQVADTGFHPLDGARYLRDEVRADWRVCSLVAYHSSSHIEARRRGLLGELTSEFVPVRPEVSDALTFCDVTTTPTGEDTSVESRVAEVVHRYGNDHPVSLSVSEARPSYVAASRAVERLVAAAH
jgi:hypothetical protein